jgi:hypothetical protein
MLPASLRRKVWTVKSFVKTEISCIFRYIINSISHIFGYIYEMITFIFTRNSIRVSFVNFWPGLDREDCWFLVPLKSYLKPHRIVKYFNIDIQFFSVFGSIDKLLISKAKYKIFFTGENVNKNSIVDEPKLYERNCIDYVHLSMGYDYMDNDNYIRLPLGMLYFFTPLDTKDAIQKN